MKEQRLMTIRETSEALRVSEGFIRKRVALGEIPFCRIGRCIRFERELINSWLKTSRYRPFGIKGGKEK